MPQIINTNMLSLNAQRNLNQSQSAQATAIQRLSSGLRINSSKDDAAGLAISDRFTTQIRGMSQAARNAQDAVSLSQTAEGALSSVTSNLQRMRELAVQSANGTNSSNERSALQLEFDQLRQEINRISSQTAFAGVKLLDGTFSNVNFQVGSNAGETLTISSLANVSSSVLGSYNAASVSGTVTVGTNIAALGANDLTITGPSSATAVSLGAISQAANETARAAQIRAAVNAVSGQTGVYAIDGTNNVVQLWAAGNITVTASGAATAATSGFAAGATTQTASAQTGFASASIATATGASQAMVQMDAALSAVASSRATMGSIQSRFEAVISNLQVTTENLTAARSRIQDADFAEETAKLTRAQILQQAGTAMLAQANSAPQSVLALLR
jgi:flagellin